MAIRKNHARPNGRFKRGDLFEIILIQIKGGGVHRRTLGKIVGLYYNHPAQAPTEKPDQR